MRGFARHRIAGLAAAAGLALTACDGGGSGAAPTASPPSASPSASATASPTPDPVPLEDVRIALSDFADGLDAPVFLTHAGDGSGALYVLEQEGRIRLLSAEGAVQDTFADLTDRIQAGGERGLLGLAFHPSYKENGRLFVNYTNRSGDTVVAELRRSSATRADPESHRVLLTIEQPFANHNGGMLAFDPEGYLLIGTGDGGSGGDPRDHGQDRSVLLGKLLRLDVDGGRPYAIPPGNPYASGDGADEIWAIGLRNPWRFSLDTASGGIFIADVGQRELEEVNARPISAAGENYGWRIMEGDECFRPSSGCDRDGLVLPAVTYSHAQGCSVSGGYVYRGARHPELTGRYFYGDYCSGNIWAMDADAALEGSAAAHLLLESGLRISSFGVDEAGEVYVVDIGGSIKRIRAR